MLYSSSWSCRIARCWALSSPCQYTSQLTHVTVQIKPSTSPPGILDKTSYRAVPIPLGLCAGDHRQTMTGSRQRDGFFKFLYNSSRHKSLTKTQNPFFDFCIKIGGTFVLEKSTPAIKIFLNKLNVQSRTVQAMVHMVNFWQNIQDEEKRVFNVYLLYPASP
jgi:hypothetical protein